MLSIILPVLNEGENLKILIPRLDKLLKKTRHEIIIVDDDSRDDTAKIIRDLQKKTALRYILRKGKKGLSSAVIDGFRKARGDRYIVMDSDLSHPPEVISRITGKLNHYDIVIASRYIRGGGVKEWPWFRRMVSNFATLLTRPIVRIKDPMAGFFGLKKKVVQDTVLDPIGFKILLEILVKGHYRNVLEIPYIFLERHAGRSKAGIKIYLEYNLHLLKLYFYKLKIFVKGLLQ
ncbi:MAG: polyprenol monophosphomannose synthase [bacterium]|nr:polyprenol monophosphomannose synthase [bacterium]